MNRSNSSFLRDRRRIIRQVWHDNNIEYDAMHIDTEHDIRPDGNERERQKMED
jgi:hypothetical protein